MLRAIFTGLVLATCALPTLPAAQTPEGLRPLRVQIYYWQRSNSTYIETVETIGQRPPPRFQEPVSLWYRSGEKFENVRVRSGDRSSAFTMAAGKDITFYRQDPTQLKEIPPDIILTIPVSPHVQQGLIITRDSNLKGAEIIDVSDARIPKGSLRLVNQTAEQIVVKIGDQVSPLKPGDTATLSPKPDKEDRINLMMAKIKKNNEWGIFYSSVVSMDKDSRILAMIYPSGENSKNVKVQLLLMPD